MTAWKWIASMLRVPHPSHRLIELAAGPGCTSPWSWSPCQVWRLPLAACLAAKPVDRRNGLVRLNPMGAKIQIRPGAATELPALVEALGQRPFFADRLARQHQGRGVLLVAWLDDHPVGDVYLLREPADVPKVRLHLPGVPQLDHLEVMGPLQRRGIGTALIHAGEDTARRLGDEQLAPGVGLANIHARRLYERLGYVDWGHGPVVGTWRAVGDDGTAVAVSQLIDLLVKHL
jgi:GNAT superfamily N-acetyltransferase